MYSDPYIPTIYDIQREAVSVAIQLINSSSIVVFNIDEFLSLVRVIEAYYRESFKEVVNGTPT